MGLDGLLVGFLVHVAKHQYVLGLGILDDSGNKSTALFKIYLHATYIFLVLTQRYRDTEFYFFSVLIYILTFMPSAFR